MKRIRLLLGFVCLSISPIVAGCAADGTGSDGAESDDTGDDDDVAGDDDDSAGDDDDDDVGSGVALGPMSNLHLWKDGCSSQLWGRWTSDDDYQLDFIQLKDSDGNVVASKTYYDLTFSAGFDEAWMFFDDATFSDTQYSVFVDFASQPDATASITLDPGFYTDDSRFDPGAVLQSGPDGGLAVYVTPSFNGTVQRVMVYDDSWCRQSWKVFYTEPALSNGSSTRLDLGGFYESGTSLNLTIEGVNTGTNYTYYGTAAIVVP